MPFRPLLCIKVDEDTDLRVYEERQAQEVAENFRSCAIPKRLGFTQEGILRDAQWLYDHYVNTIIYGLLAREWQD